MLSKSMLLFNLLITILVINGSVQACSETYCWNKKCASQKASDCKSTEILKPADPTECRCCPRCVECDGTICSTLKCMVPKSCEEGTQLEPSDGKCHCCPYCKPCNPNKCLTVKCAGVSEGSCKPGTTYVPADTCNCCSYCKKNVV